MPFGSEALHLGRDRSLDDGDDTRSLAREHGLHLAQPLADEDGNETAHHATSVDASLNRAPGSARRANQGLLAVNWAGCKRREIRGVGRRCACLHARRPVLGWRRGGLGLALFIKKPVSEGEGSAMEPL